MFRLITVSISHTLLFWRPSFLSLKSPIAFLIVWSGSSEFSEVMISSTLWMVCCQDSIYLKKVLMFWFCCCCSVAESCPLWPHRLQHARLPSPSLSPRVCSNSYPLSQWCRPTISYSVVNHLILCHPLLLLTLIFPSTRVFSNESALRIRWPKDWSFSFSISPSNEYSRLISIRNDWFDLLVVQRTLKSLPQHHSLGFSILKTLGRSRHHCDLWLHSLHFSHDDFKYIEINF